jgi:hypothetical protein
LDGFERQYEARAVSAIAGVDADDVDDGRVVEGETDGNPPSLRANANQITGTNPEVRWRHALSKSARAIPFGISKKYASHAVKRCKKCNVAGGVSRELLLIQRAA